MISMPLVSVIIVTYNQMHYIFETIDSVLIQDYPNIELIVCDDCSVEFDIASIERYLGQHNAGNITNVIIHQNETNLGTVKNINGGIKLSSGKYLKIIAGDDLYYDETVFKFQIEYLENNDKMLVAGKVQQFWDNGTRKNDMYTDMTNELLNGLFDRPSHQIVKIIKKTGIFPICTQAICFRREYFSKTGLMDERYVLIEDIPLLHKIIRNSTKVGFIDQFCVLHRVAVGISSNIDLFSQRQIRYFMDLANSVRYEMIPYPELYGKLGPKMQLKAAEFRCDMCEAESQSQKIGLITKNLDALVFYMLSYPLKFFNKIKGILTRR
jgi:glycosyltransferase involved in cell wall biosynthesis